MLHTPSEAAVGSNRATVQAAPLQKQIKPHKSTVLMDENSENAVKLKPIVSEFKSKYVVGNILGRGGFSTVREASRKADGITFAVKIIDRTHRDPRDEKAIKNEIEILRLIGDHPNVTQIVDIFEEPEKIYIVMELVSGGELFDRIIEKEYFSEADSRDVMEVIFRTLQHMHECGIVHRDLKPENILYASKQPNASIKIADFGLARMYRRFEDDDPTITPLSTMCGTPSYVAPEVVTAGMTQYTAQCDMWSAGVLLFVMLVGYPPFVADNPPMLFRKIRRCEYSFASPYWDLISLEAKDLVSKLLVVDLSERFTPTQALAHPWMKTASAGSSMDLLNLRQYVRQRNQRKFQLLTHTLSVAKRLEQLVLGHRENIQELSFADVDE